MQESFFEDLDLQAFRYIADEMTAAEADAFEQRLADDQVAREAVARAVGMAQAVASVRAAVIPMPHIHRSPRTAHQTRTWIRPARWIAAVAAVVLAILGIQLFKGSSDQTALVKVWANLRLGQDAGETPNFDLIADSEESAIDDENDLIVPGWMMEAVESGSDPDKWEDS